MKARIGKRAITVRGSRVGTSTARTARVTDQPGAPGPAPIYDSKWEERYATMLELEQKAGHIVKYWYHPMSPMRLPGGTRYQPDFLVQHHEHLEMVDVKGYHKNIREAMLRIKVAAAIYTCYTWNLAKWNGRDFDKLPVEVEAW